MTTPEIAALASDPRLLRIVRESLGQSAVPYRATLFEKSGRANWLVSWHQDTALPLATRIASNEWDRWSVKNGLLYAHAPASALDRILALRVHLDASTVANGPLCVIPDSHRAGVLNSNAVFEIARQQKPVECPVPRGGVMAMRPLLIHSSSRARVEEPRRVLHLEYADTLDLGEGIRLALA
jgi:ectoine hydroxylase-related dioxygenase (phytanoyl-CoA dioxygenase family)